MSSQVVSWTMPVTSWTEMGRDLSSGVMDIASPVMDKQMLSYEQVAKWAGSRLIERRMRP